MMIWALSTGKRLTMGLALGCGATVRTGTDAFLAGAATYGIDGGMRIRAEVCPDVTVYEAEATGTEGGEGERDGAGAGVQELGGGRTSVDVEPATGRPDAEKSNNLVAGVADGTMGEPDDVRVGVLAVADVREEPGEAIDRRFMLRPIGLAMASGSNKPAGVVGVASTST
jgi:hypothetical protein